MWKEAILKGTIGKGGKLSEEKLERKTNHERLLTLGNELGVVEREVDGVGRGDWVTGTEEGT